jgi:hypothetical protein
MFLSALSADQIVAFVTSTLLGFFLVLTGNDKVVAVLDGADADRRRIEPGHVDHIASAGSGSGSISGSQNRLLLSSLGNWQRTAPIRNCQARVAWRRRGVSPIAHCISSSRCHTGRRFGSAKRATDIISRQPEQ